MPSRVKDASSVNKMTLPDVLLPSGTIPYVEHGRLVSDVVPFDRGKDINRPHVMFATPAYDTVMREAILRVDTRGLLCTISRMFSRVFIVLTISLSIYNRT